MNVKNNNLSDTITPIPKAIDAQTGTRELFLDARGDLFPSFYSTNKRSNTLQVECVTLKQVLKENSIEHVDYLKMDCEGAEWEILKAIDEETISRIGIIGMEYHLKSRGEFVKLLLQLGFSVFDSDEEWRNSSYILAAKH